MLNLPPNTQSQMVDEERKPESTWYSFFKNLSNSTNKIENQKDAINALNPPTGGEVIDEETRNSINQIISILKSLV